jgi:hypothetical protein
MIILLIVGVIQITDNSINKYIYEKTLPFGPYLCYLLSTFQLSPKEFLWTNFQRHLTLN